MGDGKRGRNEARTCLLTSMTGESRVKLVAWCRRLEFDSINEERLSLLDAGLQRYLSEPWRERVEHGSGMCVTGLLKAAPYSW